MIDLTVITLDPTTKGGDGRNPYGLEPKMADAGLSLGVIAANPPVPQACWRNAMLAYWSAVIAVAEGDGKRRSQAEGTVGSLFVTPLPEPANATAVYYVEGQMLMPLKSGGQFCIEHAWLETEDGRVIECTLREAAAGEDGWLYFTGLRLSMDEALDWLSDNRNTLPLSPLLSRRRGAEAQAQAHHVAMLAAYWQAWGLRLDRLDGCALAFE